MPKLEDILFGFILGAAVTSTAWIVKENRTTPPPVQQESIASITSIDFTTLYRTGNAFPDEYFRKKEYSKEPFGIVIKNQQALNELYAQMQFPQQYHKAKTGMFTDEPARFVPVHPPYKPDFSKEMVLATYQGWRGNGGQSIYVCGLSETSTHIIVSAILKEHLSTVTYPLTCAVETPGHLVVCPKSEKPVIFTWIEQDRNEGKFRNPFQAYKVIPNLSAEEEKNAWEKRAQIYRKIEEDCINVGGSKLQHKDLYYGVSILDTEEQIKALQKKGYTVEKVFPYLK